jgi:hypothetical protein
MTRSTTRDDAAPMGAALTGHCGRVGSGRACTAREEERGSPLAKEVATTYDVRRYGMSFG